MSAHMEVSNSQHSIRSRIIVTTLVFLILLLISFLSLSNDNKASAKDDIKAESQFVRSSEIDVTTPSDDPIVTVTCIKPIFTLALVIDRSGSVYNNRDIYIKTVKDFVTTLSDRITGEGSNGTLKVIVNAFASRSVNQNNLNESKEMVTDITDVTTRDDFLQVLDEIHFVKDGWGTGSFAASGEPDDIRKAYNPTFATQVAEGMHNATNWEDATKAVVDIRNAGFNGTEQGKRIDLMLMLTDGAPTTSNGSDNIFTPEDDIKNYDVASLIAEGTIAAKNNVKELRNPSNGAYPTPVRGVLVKSSKESAMKTVFGSNIGKDYFKAEDFDESLSDVLESLSDDITTNEECTTTYVYPKIKVTVNPSPMIIEEGGPGTVGTITVQNLTVGSALENVTLSTSGYNEWGMLVQVPGFPAGYLAPYGQFGDTYVYNFTFKLELGESFPDKYDIYAWGQLPNNPKIKAVSGIDPVPKSEADLQLTTVRAALPA